MATAILLFWPKRLKTTGVLDVHSGEFRHVAYLVKWHGARVAVIDMFANTHYAVGDRICFPVSRIDSSSGRELSFMLFNLPSLNSKPECGAHIE
jgi:hypothetical protein